jgi:hypothetical protein
MSDVPQAEPCLRGLRRLPLLTTMWKFQDSTSRVPVGWWGRQSWRRAGFLAGFRLRPRHDARPTILFRTSHKTCGYGVPLDVRPDPLKLSVISNPMIEGFLLPKGQPGSAQQPVCFARREALYRMHDLRQFHAGRNQQVHMIGHHYPGMQPIVAENLIAMMQSFNDHPRDSRLPQPQGTLRGTIDETVHTDEGIATAQALRWHITMRRKAPVQPPGDEQVFTLRRPVWETAVIVGHRIKSASMDRRFSGEHEAGPETGLPPRLAAPH